MLQKSFCSRLAVKLRGTRFPDATILVIFLSLLASWAGEATAATWQAQGPTPIYGGESVIVPNNDVVGAVQSLLINPADNNIMYIGAVNGGIWKTTDGGATWNPLTDNQTSLSMGAMAFAPGNPNRILAGSGQFSNAGIDGPQAGLIFSRDAGKTWTPVGGAVTANTNVASIVFLGQVMFAASRSHTTDTVTGLFRSTDGGASFIKISGSGGLPTGSVTSLATDPSNPNRLYAALQNSGVFRSDDQGKTWTNITPPGSDIGQDTANIQVSVGAGGQSLFMGYTTGTEKPVVLQSVWRSLDHGATWHNMGGVGSGLPNLPGQGLPGTMQNGAFASINNDGQGKINFALLADSQNPNIVYISGDDQPGWNQIDPNTTRAPFPNQIGALSHTASIFRGDASQPLSSPPAVDYWTPTTTFNGQWVPVVDNFAAYNTTPHADSRTMTFDALGNLLETNDGGIYRRSVPQSSAGQWISLIGNLQITEMHGISYDSNTHTLFSGNQDTGSAMQTTVNGTPSSIWNEQLGADGGQTAVNDNNPNFSVRYLSEQALGEFTHLKVDLNNNLIGQAVKAELIVDGKPLKTGEGTDIPDQSPVRVNQADQANQTNQTQLAIGTTSVYLTTDDISGTLSPTLTLTKLTPQPFPSPVTDMAYYAPNQPGQTNFLLVAGADLVNQQLQPALWLSTTLLPGSLNKLTNYPGANAITGVFIDPNAAVNNQLYVADGSCLRSSNDQGGSWVTGLSLYQLRSLQVITNGLNAVVVGGYGTLYAARDTDLNNWYSLKGNLPNTFVWQMDYSSRDDTLVVGTLGRGAFTLAHASTLLPATPTSVDSGWIRLLNANSPDQTINGGTVQNPYSATLPMNFSLTALGGTFDTLGPDPTSGTTTSLTGVISGPGSLTVTGNGSLSLQGQNTYEGGTFLNGGTVIVAGDAHLGKALTGLTFDGGTLQTGAVFSSARSITLQPNGGTFDTGNVNAALTLTGIIAGPGTLTKTGPGLLALLPQGGPNTYSGGTLLQGGTLQVSNDQNLGAASGPLSFNGGTLQAVGGVTTSRTMVVLANGGTLDTGTSASVLNGEFFGFGTFTQQGGAAGKVTLAGDGSPFTGTYTVSGGGAFTLNNALGSVLGPCSLSINPGSTLSGGGSLVGSLSLGGDGSGFSGSVTVPPGSTLSGTGPLAGSLSLAGDGSGFSGTYTVTRGAFSLDNALGSGPTPATVVVGPGGVMTGTGPLVGSLVNRGTVSPGHSPGTLSVVGSYTQTAGATCIAEIASPGSYDRIAVSGAPGTASLAGTLSPVLLNGYRPSGNTVFPGVVTASGGISGSFSTISNQRLGPTLFWQPRYGAASVDLVVQRDYANPGLGLNANQLSVGTLLNRVAGVTAGDLNTVLNAVDSLPAAAGVQEAYKQMSPEKAGALADLGFGAASFQVRNLAHRTTNLRFVQGGSGAAGSLAPGGLSCSYSRQSGIMLAYNGGFLPDLFSARREFKAPENPWGLFADGGAAFGARTTTSRQTGYNATLGGLTLGADYRVSDQFLVGLATGYSHTAAGFAGSGGRASLNTVPINAYAAYFAGQLYAYGSLGYALNLYDLRRDLNFGGMNRTAAGSTTGHQFNLYGEAGYDLKLRRVILTPAATLAYSALWLESFTEQNAGALNLRVGSQNASSVQTGLGGRLTVPVRLGRVFLVPQAYAFYQHEFANGSRGLNAALSQGLGSFAWQTDAAGQNFALLGASLTAGLKENLYAQVNVNAEVGRKNAAAQFLNAGLRYEF